jgi:pyridoxamine 5'-phosphate oxidase
MTKVDKKISHHEPFEKFKEWFDKALADERIIEPSAMCLATVDEENHPSARMVLLKKYDSRGFCFLTNLTSRKGKELNQNQNVALCFYWGVLGLQKVLNMQGRQIRILFLY